MKEAEVCGRRDALDNLECSFAQCVRSFAGTVVMTSVDDISQRTQRSHRNEIDDEEHVKCVTSSKSVVISLAR